MTIYMVQQTFSKPELEEEWNEWYAGNLPILMRVPGFKTGQRFKSPIGSPPRYMAMYTVEADVFESKFYLDSGGGGTNSQRFRSAYQVWIRNLFEGLLSAPSISKDEFLIVVDISEKKSFHSDLQLTWLESTGFHRSTPLRGLAIAKSDQVSSLINDERITIYQPLSEQMGHLY